MYDIKVLPASESSEDCQASSVPLHAKFSQDCLNALNLKNVAFLRNMQGAEDDQVVYKNRHLFCRFLTKLQALRGGFSR